jgi:hypothetical protein
MRASRKIYMACLRTALRHYAARGFLEGSARSAALSRRAAYALAHARSGAATDYYFLAAAFFLCLAGSFGRDLPKDPR